MLNGGHDLNLPTDPDEVSLGLDLALLDRLDRNLEQTSVKNLRSFFLGGGVLADDFKFGKMFVKINKND